jgi:hypothetical protein
MMTREKENELRVHVQQQSNLLAGRPLDMGVKSINPSQVRGLEAKLTATGVRRSFGGQHGEMRSLLSGASTIQNYAKAAPGFAVQNDLLESFCRLLSQQTGESCGIIMGPSKKETSTLKKYWAGGRDASGWQGDFKDLCRCTIVCYVEKVYSDLPRMIRHELANDCYAKKWMIVTPEKGKPGDIGKIRTRDNEVADDLGYTDTNISLVFPNAAKVEVQINIQSTLYGKMGRPAFIEEACPPGLGEAQYASMVQ